MKTAIVGLGVIGKVHERVLEELGTPAACACDILEEEIARYGEHGYRNFSEMLEKEKPQIVHICTPHYLHAEMVIEALKKGVNVLCEKPLCIRREEIERILEAERNSSARLGVCFQNRYNPSTIFAKELLKDKKIRTAHGKLFWHRDAAYYAQAAWRGKKETEGGGVLVNQAIHTLDLLQLFCGMPNAVTAYCQNLSLQGVIEVEDTVRMLCVGERQFSLFATNAAKVERPVEIAFTTDDGQRIRLVQDGVFVDEKYIDCSTAPGYGKRVYGSGHGNLIADFHDCIKTGRRFEINGEEGAKAVKIMLAAYESDGKEIQI